MAVEKPVSRVRAHPSSGARTKANPNHVVSSSPQRQATQLEFGKHACGRRRAWLWGRREVSL